MRCFRANPYLRGIFMKQSGNLLRLSAASAMVVCITVVAAAMMSSCESKTTSNTSATKPVTIAFVTNNPSDFWQIAKAGVNKAEKEFGVTCDFQMPPDSSVAEQQRIVEAEMAKGVQGMAISPNDP